MNPKLTALVDRQRGVFSRADAIGCGYTDAQIRARVRRGDWIRLRRGMFRPAPLAADDVDELHAGDEHHKLVCRAVIASLNHRRHPPAVVASHQSAVTAHGLPTWGLDLSRVHVVRTDAAPGRTTIPVAQHKRPTDLDIVRSQSGIVAVPVAEAVVGAITLGTFEAGVVLADAALRSAGLGVDDLRSALDRLGPVRGCVLTRRVLAFADGRSESVGESRLRVLMDTMRLPVPTPQYEIVAGDGQVVARVDFCFPAHATVVEFDGVVKYRKDAVETVIREKRREDRIRELGYEVVRTSWADLDVPQQTAVRILRAMGRARSVATNRTP